MRNTKKPFRLAVFTCLNGNIVYNGNTIKVYDEKRKVGDTDTIFILLSQQTETPEHTSDAFIRRSTIDIDIINKSGSEVSKDGIDDIEELIMDRIWPTPTTTGLIDPSLFQIQELTVDRSASQNVSLSETESILVNTITISAIFTQQYV